MSSAKTQYITALLKINKLKTIEPKLENDQKQLLKLVDAILEINDETEAEIYDQIEKNESFIQHIFDLIEYAIKIRPLKKEKLLNLFAKLTKKYSYSVKQKTSKEFKNILAQKGIIESDAQDPDLTQVNYKIGSFIEGSIEWAIMNDNVAILKALIDKPGFDPMGKVTIEYYLPIYFVSDDVEKDLWDKDVSISVTYMQLIVFFSAKRCFRLAMRYDKLDETDCERYAIAGGDQEIIETLEKKKHSFDDCFETAVRFNHLEICDWLLGHYRCEILSLASTLEYYNDRAFYYFVFNKFTHTKDEYDNALIAAAETGNLPVVKYLINKYKADINAKDTYRCTPLLRAADNGHLPVIEYLINECDVSLSQRDSVGRTALHRAAINGQLELVQFLIKKCDVCVDIKDSNRMTPLLWACESGKLDVVKFLIEKCGAFIEQRDKDKATPLLLASQHGYIHVVEYLVWKHAEITEACINEACRFCDKENKRSIQDLLRKSCITLY